MAIIEEFHCTPFATNNPGITDTTTKPVKAGEFIQDAASTLISLPVAEKGYMYHTSSAVSERGSNTTNNVGTSSTLKNSDTRGKGLIITGTAGARNTSYSSTKTGKDVNTTSGNEPDTPSSGM